MNWKLILIVITMVYVVYILACSIIGYIIVNEIVKEAIQNYIGTC